MELTKVGTSLSKMTGRGGLVLKKYSPEILMIVGVTGIIGSTFMACKATLKVEEVINEHQDKIDKIESVTFKVENGEIDAKEYTEEDKKKDLTVIHVQTAVNFVKLYGPAVSLGVASIACIIASHGIMQKRQVALVAAYKAVEEGFTAYRKRVVEEYGEEKDYMFKNGLRVEEITETEVDENGKSKKVKKEKIVADENNPNIYARYFDETCKRWSPTMDYNLLFLNSQQGYANQLLKSRGHVFLNEVYDALGIPRSKEGAVVGWVLGEGDDFVDFGYMNNEAFMSGRDNTVLLDFNVSGVIYDMI